MRMKTAQKRAHEYADRVLQAHSDSDESERIRSELSEFDISDAWLAGRQSAIDDLRSDDAKNHQRNLDFLKNSLDWADWLEHKNRG